MFAGWCCVCIPIEKSYTQRTRSAHAGHKTSSARERFVFTSCWVETRGDKKLSILSHFKNQFLVDGKQKQKFGMSVMNRVTQLAFFQLMVCKGRPNAGYACPYSLSLRHNLPALCKIPIGFHPVFVVLISNCNFGNSVSWNVVACYCLAMRKNPNRTLVTL